MNRALAVGLGAAAAFLVVAGAIAAVLTSADEDAFGMKYPPLQPGETVLLIGDSIGVGLTQPLSIALAQREVTLVAQPHSGWTAKRVRELLEQQPSLAGHVVVVSLGSNDAAGLPAGEGPDIEAIVNMAFARGARRVLWVYGPNFALETPPPPATKEKQQIFMSLVEAAKGTDPFLPPPEVVQMLGPDRVHLPPAGYAALAAAIVSRLTE